jgi:hypothetical protein
MEFHKIDTWGLGCGTCATLAYGLCAAGEMVIGCGLDRGLGWGCGDVMLCWLCGDALARLWLCKQGGGDVMNSCGNDGKGVHER